MATSLKVAQILCTFHFCQLPFKGMLWSTSPVGFTQSSGSQSCSFLWTLRDKVSWRWSLSYPRCITLLHLDHLPYHSELQWLSVTKQSTESPVILLSHHLTLKNLLQSFPLKKLFIVLVCSDKQLHTQEFEDQPKEESQKVMRIAS